MRAYFLGCVLLMSLAACASHPPRCGGRLTPINRPSIWRGGTDPRSVATHPAKAERS